MHPSATDPHLIDDGGDLMNRKKWGACVLLFLFSFAMATFMRDGAMVLTKAQSVQRKSPPIELVTAEELKAKLARNEAVTIIDVRATSSYVDSDARIKGAIYVKLRRLSSRLGFPPLKNVPRNSEVVTYCACPNDESSTRAAQILSDAGFQRVRILKGGWRMWLKVNGQVEPRPKAM
jgi:rhodanese-related sulfurtransferase